jgi:hypothetical protein
MTAVLDTVTTPVEDLLARAHAYVTHSHAKNTLDAYAADWKHFSAWCDDHKRRALPASTETILCYIVDLAERYIVATLDRRLSNIGYYHKQARHALPTKDPEVERTMRSIRRAKGVAPNGKAPSSRHCCARWLRHCLMTCLVCGTKHSCWSGSQALFRSSGLTICKLQMMQTVPQPHNTLPHSILSGLSIERYSAFKICPSYSLLQQQAVDEQIRAYGIHLLFKQAADGAVIIGDSHEYCAIEQASALEETTSSAINAAILRYGQQMLDLPSWEIARMWNGYYMLHPERPIYTQTIDDRIQIVTGIAGKGMSTAPGFARRQIDSILSLLISCTMMSFARDERIHA